MSQNPANAAIDEPVTIHDSGYAREFRGVIIPSIGFDPIRLGGLYSKTHNPNWMGYNPNHNYQLWKIAILMGKSTINAIFHSYVS